ncbi:MAG: cysteine hydrolase [Anaerolineae bacterium]|nr:cysteine hydrolase [Anaerolineae bacterium]
MLELSGRYIRAGAGPQAEPLRLAPAETALLLVDVYYDDQARGRWGPPEDPFTARFAAMEGAIATALDAARAAALQVIYATNSAPRIGVPRSAFGRHFRRAWGDEFDAAFAEGGVDPREYHQGNRATPLKFAPRLAPLPAELYLRKHTYSAFFDTRLDTALRNLGIHTLVCAGLWANVCLAATSLDALYRNYEVIWLRDGTLAGSEDTGRWIAWFEEVVGFTVSSAEFAAACRRLTP